MKGSHFVTRQMNDTATKPSLVGKLTCLHLFFFLICAFFLYMTIYNRYWMATIAVLLFIKTGLLLTAQFNLRRYNRLTEIWTELVRQTGLELVQGRPCLIGTPDPPSVRGIYHHHQLSIEKVVENIGDYEGSVSAVFTRITLEVANTSNRLLHIHKKPFLLSFQNKITSGNKNFDRRFECGGRPEDFIQKIACWVSQQPALYERPTGVIMLTDSLLSFTNWSAPSIHLEGSKLIYLQSGVVSNVIEELNIINLICGLAELAEEKILD